MKKNINKIKVGIVVAMLVSMSTIPSFAKENNYPYSFRLKAGNGNSYSAAKYRQTTDRNNKWKVNMTFSEEGKGTIATYWLALDDKNKTFASDTHDIKQGSGDHYYKALGIAGKKNVRLGAENNNYSSRSYLVAGYWDEETK